MKINILFLFLSMSIILARERQYVFDLNITGNKQIETSQLKNKIRLKSRGTFSKTEFNTKKLHLDEITLKNYYQTCPITRSSTNMANCVESFISKERAANE